LPSLRKGVNVALTCLGLVAAQSIAPDEIHSRTFPYVPPAGLTLRTEVRVVEVPVVVRDGFLHAVSGLTRDDFEIYDDGKRQAITAFSVEHFTPPGDASTAVADAPKGQPRPRFLALCFDDLHLLPGPLNAVKEAGKKFVRTSLAPGDRAVVVRTSRSEDVSFTNDAAALAEQIDKITPPIMDTNDDKEKCPHIAPHEAYQIANGIDPGNHVLHAKMAECVPCFNRACSDREVIGRAQVMWTRIRQNTGNGLGVIGSLVDGMAKLPGQRIIVLTSGGFLTGTLEADVDRLMEKARRAEVVINGLDGRGLTSMRRRAWLTTGWACSPPARAARSSTTTIIWIWASGSWVCLRRRRTYSASRLRGRPTVSFTI